jgi:3-hydroxyacyl-[acyl-carrier-protein] dehydratase
MPSAAPSTATPAHVPLTAEAEIALRDSLRRCSAKTVEAAVAYGQTGAPQHIPAIIIGIIERFVEPELRPRLAAECDDLRVIEDLGLDSLTMMEIVMLVEEVTQTKIENDELRGLVTIGDIKIFVDCRARGVTPPAPAKVILSDELRNRMPISAPFLFLDEARVSPTLATASYRITGQEFFLAGHFKGNPVMPASIMLEALGQLGVLHLLAGLAVEPGKAVGVTTIFFASTDGVRCHRVCKPGDVLTLTLKPKRVKEPLAVYTGSIRVGQEKAISAEEITLTFGIVDAPPAPEPVPSPAAEPISAPAPVAATAAPSVPSTAVPTPAA